MLLSSPWELMKPQLLKKVTIHLSREDQSSVPRTKIKYKHCSFSELFSQFSWYFQRMKLICPETKYTLFQKDMVKFCQSHYHHILLCLLRAQLNLRKFAKWFFFVAALITPCSWSEPCALPHHSTCYKQLPWGGRIGSGRIFHQVIITIKYISIYPYIDMHLYLNATKAW